jgi:hypothetical protein
MLLQLKTGQVQGYSQGQSPLIYLVSSVEAIQLDGCRFVFTDGHGIATFTAWYDNSAQLDQVEWSIVNARYWIPTPNDPDRQRKKQAEFLVHERCPINLITEIGVLDLARYLQVRDILNQHACAAGITVNIRNEWYYY